MPSATSKQSTLPASWLLSPRKEQRTCPSPGRQQTSLKSTAALSTVSPPSAVKSVRKGPKKDAKAPTPHKKHTPLIPIDPSKKNYNKRITDVLSELSKTEKNIGNQWKAQAYSKAILSISAYPKPLVSGKEAQDLPGVGGSIAKLVQEIIETGTSERVQNEAKDERLQTISMLMRVSGIGPSAAAKFYDELGVRSISDLLHRPLTRHQKIGMKYFNEFEKRIPRAEMDRWQAIIKDVLEDIDDRFVVTIAGSYRRGQDTCGDIDVLLTHPEFTTSSSSDETPNSNHSVLLQLVISRLHEKGYLTDDISLGDVKYMGVCKLPDVPNTEAHIHRRIDIRLSPIDMYWPAVFHSTGSDQFNRWIRSLAAEQGYTLSEYSLRTKDKKSGAVGTPLRISSEEDIFRLLGVEWRAPEQRDW
ncbi:DNA-directed DNA polymerase [Spizellomyces sp. 'palustris']|nr:DNA-directed DNA polymerase [Spizellomyces sp. 'palustris']